MIFVIQSFFLFNRISLTAQHERTGAEKESDDVPQVGQVVDDVERVVEREHEQIAKEDGDVRPHGLLLERGGRRQARLLDEAAETRDQLA